MFDAAHTELLVLATAVLAMMVLLAFLKSASRKRGLNQLGRRRRVIRPNHSVLVVSDEGQAPGTPGGGLTGGAQVPTPERRR